MSGNPLVVVRRTMVEAGAMGSRYWWVAPLVLGFLPALLFSNVLLGSISAANWSCTSVAFGASGSQYGGCSIIAGELIVVVTISWLAPLFVLSAFLYLRKRSHEPAGDRETGAFEFRAGIFVRVVAILVGFGNMLYIGDPFDFVGAPSGRPTATLIGVLLLSVPVGLLASGIVLRRGRAALAGSFFARYGVAVLGLCLGGAILGGSSSVLTAILNYDPGLPPGAENGIFFIVYGILAYGTIAAIVGGVLGLLEGLILGLPLAFVLGRLRQPPQGPAHDAPFPHTTY